MVFTYVICAYTMRHLGISGTQTANMLCGLAIGDYVNNSMTSRDIVLKSLNTMFTLVPDIVGS